MNDKIKHKGVVTAINGNNVKVRCKIAGHCNASESKEKVIDIFNANTENLQKGDTVVVSASKQMGLWAVLLSSVVPLAILIATLAVMTALKCNEMIAASVSLGALVPYYAILWLCRNKIDGHFSFQIER